VAGGSGFGVAGYADVMGAQATAGAAAGVGRPGDGGSLGTGSGFGPSDAAGWAHIYAFACAAFLILIAVGARHRVAS
jgi:hypothetical protein